MHEAIEGMESIGSRVSGRTMNTDDIGLTAELLNRALLLLDRVYQISSKYGQDTSETKTE